MRLCTGTPAEATEEFFTKHKVLCLMSHPHLLGQLEKDVFRSSKAKEVLSKRIMPGRMAAPRGPKRYNMALD